MQDEENPVARCTRGTSSWSPSTAQPPFPLAGSLLGDSPWFCHTPPTQARLQLPGPTPRSWPDTWVPIALRSTAAFGPYSTSVLEDACRVLWRSLGRSLTPTVALPSLIPAVVCGLLMPPQPSQHTQLHAACLCRSGGGWESHGCHQQRPAPQTSGGFAVGHSNQPGCGGFLGCRCPQVWTGDAAGPPPSILGALGPQAQLKATQALSLLQGHCDISVMVGTTLFAPRGLAESQAE